MEPYKIYDFEDEKAWLKGRLNGIGGSDASAVVGKNPYKTNIELFEEKDWQKDCTRHFRKALCDLWERGGAVHQGAVPPGLSTVSGHTP